MSHTLWGKKKVSLDENMWKHAVKQTGVAIHNSLAVGKQNDMKQVFMPFSVQNICRKFCGEPQEMKEAQLVTR